ncbi:hypothetical protein [Micromonospora profundi]|uniref:Uncharacterized protein n=1 Tax=Micromonospora profundi TaxID=1420889 RepID=A0AAJ6HNZ8_9ACTN|nr:hypothetical protein [Micromonospora profundi]WLS44121.1 hypothetical protein Q3V37_22325 [Micromonospora profundi]
MDATTVFSAQLARLDLIRRAPAGAKGDMGRGWRWEPVLRGASGG